MAACSSNPDRKREGAQVAAMVRSKAMFLSPLVSQIVKSLDGEPLRWERRKRLMVRDDGLQVQFVDSYSAANARPRLMAPREVAFGWFEGRIVMRAIRRWLHRRV
jgi:hypothetical protein